MKQFKNKVVKVIAGDFDEEGKFKLKTLYGYIINVDSDGMAQWTVDGELFVPINVNKANIEILDDTVGMSILFAKWIANPDLHGYCKQLNEALIRNKATDIIDLYNIFLEKVILQNNNIKYYDVHVFLNRKDGFSVYVEINHDTIEEKEESIIQYCVDKGLITTEEANMVSYVEEVSKDVYGNFNKK